MASVSFIGAFRFLARLIPNLIRLAQFQVRMRRLAHVQSIIRQAMAEAGLVGVADHENSAWHFLHPSGLPVTARNGQPVDL